MWQLKGFISISHPQAALPTGQIWSPYTPDLVSQVRGFPEKVMMHRKRESRALCRNARSKRKERGRHSSQIHPSDNSFHFPGTEGGPELA